MTHLASVIVLLVALSAAGQSYHASTATGIICYPGETLVGDACSGTPVLPCPGPSCSTPGVSLLGANTAIHEHAYDNPPYYNTSIRITDANTAGDTNASYQASAGGGTQVNWMDSSRTRFIVQNSGQITLVFSWDAAKLQATYLYSLPTASEFVSTDNQFSYVTPNLLYRMRLNGSNPAIYSYNVSSLTSLGSPTLVKDLSQCDSRLVGVGVPVHGVALQMSGDDQTFVVMIDPAYDNKYDVIIWNRTKGCRVIHTSTTPMSVTGDWGPTGNVTGTSCVFSTGMHFINISLDGRYIDLTKSTPACDDSVFLQYEWDTTSLAIQPWYSASGYLSGHNTHGYSHMLNGSSVYGNGFSPKIWFQTPFNNVNGYTYPATPPIVPCPTGTSVVPKCNAAIQGPDGWDTHASNNNQVSAPDQAPWFDSTYNGANFDPDGWWVNEILALPQAIGQHQPLTPWRFGHTFDSGYGRFNSKVRIAVVNSTGEYVLFTTDYNGGLCTATGTCPCTPSSSTTCREDAFIMLTGLAQKQEQPTGNTMESGTYATVSVEWVDKAGKPVKVDGPTKWKSSNPAVVNCEVSTGNSLIANLHALSSGKVSIEATADAALDEGIRNIMAVIEVTVIPSEAATGKLKFTQSPEQGRKSKPKP